VGDGFFERVLLPISTEEDAEITCRVVPSYFDDEADELVFVHVVETGGDGPSPSPPEAQRERGEEIFAVVRERLSELPIPVETDLRSGPDVVEEIFEAADGHEATAIALVPQPGNRLTKLLAGDYKHRITEENHLPVIVLPHPDATGFTLGDAGRTGRREPDGNRVVVPVDGSDASVEAARHAAVLFPDAELVLLHVLESRGSGVYESMTGGASSDYEEFEERRKEGVERLFGEIEDALSEFDPDVSTVTLPGDVADSIVAYAEEVDAVGIVMSGGERNGVRRRLLGGTAERIVRRSSVPVTVLK
jgi:nucleotide-binding universal stress UspA family protein